MPATAGLVAFDTRRSLKGGPHLNLLPWGDLCVTPSPATWALREGDSRIAPTGGSGCPQGAPLREGWIP